MTDPEVVRARTALLDALAALDAHRDSVVVVGAQAVYLHTQGADVALAEYTTDGDLVIDPRGLGADPRIEAAMRAAGFERDPSNDDPGTWLSPSGVPVDLIVPDHVAGRGRRGVSVPPHDRRSMRRSVGLEAALLDNSMTEIGAIDAPGDLRRFAVAVAGPGALLVAKVHKIADRKDNPRRRDNKDAHDVYRLLSATETGPLAQTLVRLVRDELSGEVTRRALEALGELFAAGPRATGSRMAGAAEEGLGDPEQVALFVSALAADVLSEVGRDGRAR